MGSNEYERLETLILGLGGYTRAAVTISAVTRQTIWPYELQRALASGRLSPKLRQILLPPRTRYRVAIECESRDEQTRLADLLRGDDGCRMSAAELIDKLERMR